MSHLERHIRDSGVLPTNRLEAARQRQQIYGGSLDTVLLELELVTPAELQGMLASATGLNAAPERLLRPRPDRPFDAIAPDLASAGWAVPLANENGRIFVAVHPDLPDDKLGQLHRTPGHVVPLVTPECVMARLAAERAGSVIPQRFAVLSVRFLEALSGVAPTRQEARPRSPTMSIDLRGPAGASLGPAGPAEVGPSSSRTLLPGPAVIPPVESRPFTPPAAPRSGPVEVRPTEDHAVPRHAAPSFAPPRTAGALSSSAEVDDAMISEVVATGRYELGQAEQRDEVTTALARAALRLYPRVALFAAKRDRLTGLRVPGGQLQSLDGTEIPVPEGSDLARIVSGRERPTEVVEPSLRATVGLSEPVPCLTVPVQVRGRTVILLYADRAGRPIAPAERAAGTTLGDAAGRALEQVLLRRRSSGPSSVAREGAAPDRPPAGAATPPVRTPPGTRLPQLVHDHSVDHRGPTIVPGATSEKIIVDDPAIIKRQTVTQDPRPPAPMEPAPPVPPAPPGAPRAAETLTGAPAETGRPRFVPPPPNASPGDGIISLSSPLIPQTTRGHIELDAEDRTAEPAFAPADSLETRADHAVERLLERDEESVSDIREFGEAGLLRLAARFPGPLEVFRRDLNALPPPSAHGPLIRAAIRLGSDMASHLTELMDHPNPDVRFYAAFVFQELRDVRCVRPLARLAFDASGDVRVISMRVLETYSRCKDFAGACEKVRAGLAAANRTRQLQAARAVGTLRDVHAVAELIELLASKDRYIQEAALESLCSITGQQHGLKPHRWRSWHDDHDAEHRVQWIIDSLKHRDAAVRRWAADELARVTGHRVTASPIGDRREQAACVQQWHDWWESAGREQMTAPN